MQVNIIIELEEPIQAHGEEITQLKYVGRATWKRLKGFFQSDIEADRIAGVIKTAFLIPPSAVDELGPEDVAAAFKGIEPFLEPFQRTQVTHSQT